MVPHTYKMKSSHLNGGSHMMGLGLNTIWKSIYTRTQREVHLLFDTGKGKKEG